jgi:chorismate synthase
MNSNSFGIKLKFHSSGESHGNAYKGRLCGFPSGISIDFQLLEKELNRRKTNKLFGSKRNEEDKLVFYSGIENGKTNGDDIVFEVKNNTARSSDYKEIKETFRPSHADFTYFHKYGEIPQGGGRASARETVLRVVAGSLAKMFLQTLDIEIISWVHQIGSITSSISYKSIKQSDISNSNLGCPDKKAETKIIEYLKNIEKSGDTSGGIVKCIINNCPIGLGEPVYNKLHAELGKAMLSINAAKAFEYGLGFEAAEKKGSEYNDEISLNKKGKYVFLSNNDGGIQGGISNGEIIHFSVGFKPVPSIKKEQKTLTTAMKEKKIHIQGRHDICFVPRVLPVVESMAALVIADYYLLLKESVTKK